MNNKELTKVLMLHTKWLKNEHDGSMADLHRADLHRADLREANLHCADLRWANLREADLIGADLRWADLIGANLSGAYLSGAYLRGADLSAANLSGANIRWADFNGADLSNANFCWADLRGADFRGADLSEADLSDANLSGANLSGANLSGCIGVPALICPEEGSYYGFKKADDHIVVLKILYTAKRSSATSRKCRASEAEVIRIENFDGSISDIKRVRSNYDNTFEYEVGKIVKVNNFDPDRWKECAPGIHHFITRQEAIDYTI